MSTTHAGRLGETLSNPGREATCTAHGNWVIVERRVTDHLIMVSTGEQDLTMQPIQCLVETAVYADNLDQAERFYRDILGLCVMAKEEDRHVFFQVGDSDVLLIFRPQSTLDGGRLPAHGCRGPGHFAMGVAADDLDARRQWLVAHGVTIEHEQTWPLGGRFALFSRPGRQLGRADHAGSLGSARGW